MPNGKETQAERNKRIEAQLKARGKSFTPAAQVRREAEQREEKRKRLQPKTNGKGNGKTNGNGTTARQPREYMSGKAFDAVQREAMKKAGI